MQVEVQFFSTLKEITGTPTMRVDVAENGTVRELLADLGERFPRLREWDDRILIGVGVEFVARDHVLRAGDEVAIMPPVQGG